MKKKTLLSTALLALLITSCATAKPNMLTIFKESYKEKNSDTCPAKVLKKMGIDVQESIPEENLSAINHILKHTYENNIHKMRGEEGNQVYTNEDCREAVYNQNGELVTNDWNKGSFNYAPYDRPVEKFLLDSFPLLVWGNTRAAPKTFDERLYYYCMDMNAGIQSYIFLEDTSALEKLSYSDLSTKEKQVYHLFDYLLCNDAYTVRLSEENRARQQGGPDSYWDYF